MKLNLKFRTLAVLTIALLTVILFSKCKKPDKKPDEKDCCEGYTGVITDSSALNLKNRCNFIDSATINDWTNRYQHYINDSLSYIKTDDSLASRASRFLKQYQISFDRCIIRTILCDEHCIGLRVLYGMSPNKKFHVILVGIDKDYNNLFVEGLEGCCNGKKLSLAESLGDNGSGGLGGGGNPGGAEYGQMP